MESYTCNDLGYLTSVKENGTLKLRYTYDNLGQLTREDNAYAGKTYVYTYDNGGNILTKKTYAYTTGTLGTVQSTVNYGYGNSKWADQLTSYNSSTITYDASGNPLKWRNASAMNWTGRQLDSMTLTNGTNVSFQYNSDGLRVSKTVGSDTVKYRWDGTTLLAEEHNDYTITFLYDEGMLVGFNYNGNNYYYGIDNLGVIHYVYNEVGTVVVTYTYDAWGNIISTSGNSSLISVNPIRYKSYYYDSETGFFYLQSRYYDSIIGRFINADSIEYLGTTEGILSLNVYAYCENNPIAFSDMNGNLSLDKFKTTLSNIFNTLKNLLIKVFDYVIGSYSPFKYSRGRLSVNSWVISAVVDGAISLLSKTTAVTVNGFLKVVKSVAKISKKSFVKFIKNTVVPFFYKKLANPLKSFGNAIVKLVVNNKYTIANDFIASNIDKLLPNTGTITNYLLSSVGSLGAFLSFILDLSDGDLDSYYTVKVK